MIQGLAGQMAEKPSPKLFADGEWHRLPEKDGSVSGTSLEVEWITEKVGPWTLRRAGFINRGNVPVKLGACHLFEHGAVADSGKDDVIFLDSSGGWFSGTVRVTERMPNGDPTEYWNEIFAAREDILWARALMPEGLDKAAHYSFGGVAVYHRPGHAFFLLGFVLPLNRCNAVPFVLNDPVTGKIRAIALSSNFAGFELASGERIETEEAILGGFECPKTALEEFASFCAVRRNIRLRHAEPPVGWLSWYGYRLDIDEKETDRIADFIQSEYPGFGFRYMQIDLGYNKNNLPGEWFEPNSHFPHGLSAFARSMRRRGFVPGLWCGAFCVGESSRFGKEHPEAMMPSENPEPARWYWEPHDPIRYVDPGHPEGQKFIRRIIRYFKSLGIRYFKIDFMNRLGRNDEYRQADPSMIRGAETYRTGMKLILDEIEAEDYFYSCSNLCLHSIGLCSTSMTACDIGNTGIHAPLAEGKRDRLDFLARQMTTTMSRYFLHGKLMLLNADSINIAPPATLEEARLRIFFVALSGGQVFLGDRFDLAEPEIRRLVRNALPPYGKAAVPVDMFRRPAPEQYPEIYHLHTPDREIFGIFNFDREKEIPVDLAEAGLNPDLEYDAWEFCDRRYVGRVSGKFTAEVPFATVRLYALTSVTPEPRVLSTTFHVTQGAVELSDVRFRRGKLSGKLTRPAGDAGSLFIIGAENGIHRLDLVGTGTPLSWEMDFGKHSG